MATSNRRAAAQPPNIYMLEAEHRRLSGLVGFSTEPASGAALLRQELDRAIIVGPADAPRSFIKLDSTVTYEDCATGKTRTVQLVLPEAADIDENRISVLTPVGAALLGLKSGQAFTWRPATGPARTVRIVSLEDRREAA
jgi:regulator of nucleoside diphosphate kinase